jgi:hypothetical protein
MVLKLTFPHFTGDPIRFSDDDDPTSEECWTYLFGKMPSAVKPSKILQKLYIRLLHLIYWGQ